MGGVEAKSKVDEARRPFKDWPNDAGVSKSLASQYHSESTILNLITVRCIHRAT
jgi:hypothetical protein